ncbi:unnamed protein product [Ectocarpus sp. CCAP 1310/34]|nr:unnamed protein product [Ectocarpus sp. CCAP 1310/34]
MAKTCDSSFTKHYQAIIDNAVGGGIVCSLGEQSLRTFLTDINITLKPQQDFIVQGLEKLKKTTEAAVAALEESGSPYKHTVVRNLRTHNAAYVTFTKEGDTFRGATKFAKGLQRTIGSAWDPPNAPVKIRLRGSGSLGVTGGPLLHEVAQSLNMVWLISAGSLEDPFCLMEVCAAVRQGTPVLPVRLAGAGMRPLNLPIWAYSIEIKPSRSGATTSSSLTASSADDAAVIADANTKNGPGNLENGSDLKDCERGSGGGEHQLAATGCGTGNTATEFRERGRRLRRRAVDGFYAQLAQRLPTKVQAELHRNRFLVKDVIAAVRSCFEGTGESEIGGTQQAGAGPADTRSDKTASATVSKARAKPPVFDISDQPPEHDMLLAALVGVNRRNTGKADVEDDANRDKGRESGSSFWNWEQVPRSAPLAGRARLTDAVPWRSDEEVSQMIKMEEAEADDLAGLLVNDMRTHPSSEQHQWEGCKGLADLAARDSDGLSAVRRQGGIQAILAALAACPKDADVQRWGCQALVPLFSDPIVAKAFRQAGIAAVIRALAVLSCCEAALKSMGAVGGSCRGSAVRGGRAKATSARTRWSRAVQKVDLFADRFWLARKIEARRKSIELELQKEIEAEEDAALAGDNDAAETNDAGESRDNANSDEGPSLGSVHAATTAAAAGARGSIDGKNKKEGRTSAEETTPEGQEESEIENNGEPEEKNKDDSSICDDALAEEQRRLEEQDRLEHEAEMARLKKELCDPYRRGKLTQHGWRVAYHLARSMKSRKLELPEALPLCLHPPGFVPGASPPAEKRNDAVDAPEGGNGGQGNREANRKGVKGSVGNGVPAVANEDRETGVGGGEGKAGEAKGKVRGKTQEKNNGKKGGGIFSRTRPTLANSSTKEKEGGKEMEAMELQAKVKTESVGEKETAAVVLGPSEDMDNNKRKTKKNKTKATKEHKEVDTDVSAIYHMSYAQKTRYTNVFDKLTTRKTEKKIGGKQAATMLAKSGLSKTDLGSLWAMADADRDGKLSRHEFAVAMHLAACAVRTPALALPSVLPPCLAAASATENEGNREGDGRVAAEEKGRQESTKGVASSDPSPAKTDEVPGKMIGMTKQALDEDHARGQKDEKEAVTGDGEGEGSAKARSYSKEKEKEGGSEYRMSDQDAARYGKAFDKLVKGKGVTLGGKKAAVVLAKSGLRKKDLGHLWVMSDVDRDGALSRMEFSIAMHLASCSAKKGLPVPRALPESLGALLPQPAVQSEERGKGVAASAEETITTGSTNTREKLEIPSASSGSGGNKGRRNKCGDDAGNKMTGAVENDQARNIGYGNKKARTTARTKKGGREEEKGNKGGSSATAATEEEAGLSKKRGFGVMSSAASSAAVAATAGESETSAAAENDITGETTKHVSPAADSGGKNKKRNKKATPRDQDQDQEHHKDGKHATTAAAATAAKRRPASRHTKLVMKEAGRSKPLEKSRAPKTNRKGKSSSPATIADKAGSAREAEESVPAQPDQQSGSDNDHAQKFALVSVPEERREGRLTAAKGGKCVAEVAAGSVEGGADRAETETEGEDAKTPTKENKSLSREERDQLYGMSTSERAGYDVIFMQLSKIWGLADANDNGELDHDEWAVALHLCRCVAHKHLPLPETLPRSLGGLGLAGGPDDDEEQSDGGRDQGPKGSKAKREAEQAREKKKRAMAGRAVKLREQTQAFRLGKVTAAAFYITLAGAFGAKRHTMIPKVARSLPLDKARALVAAAGLGEEVLEDNEVVEAKLAALRRRRVDEANLHVKATTSNATARDVSLLACRLANRLSATLDDENGGARGTGRVGGDTLGAQTSVAADMASAGGVDAVALIFRMFGALDLELMVEALQFSLILARACSAVPKDEEPASETSSLASSSHSLVEDRVVETAPEPSPLLPLLRPLYAPSVCKRVAEVAKQFSHSRKTQRLVCLLVGELGSTCGPPARRCFADCCEPIVVVAAGGLDEHAASDSDGSSVLGGIGGGGKNELSTSIVASSLPGRGVRDVACQALSVLAQESGLSRRLVAAGAGKASAVALAAAPREHSVQLYGLETIALLAESSSSPGMWESTTIDAPCRLAVQSVQTFMRDANIHRAASRAILALLVGDAAGDASRSIAAAGGATALARVLATSPNVREVQFPAVLAINELLERFRSNCAESAPTPVSEPGEEDDSASAVAAEPGNVERELIAAAGCELLCKLMKIVDAYPDDIEVRRAGLALLVGVSEHGEGTTEASDDETEENDDQGNQMTTGALASRLGFVGAVDFAGVWLRQVTAPTWAWVAGHGGGGGEEDELARAWDLLMSCKAAFLLTRHSSTNRNRLTSMGAMEALSRAVALSGRKNNLKVGLTPPVGLQQDSKLSIQAETQLWAAQALTELSGGHDNASRCSALMRCGALRALLAAMNKSSSASQLQRAGCMALGNVASCLKPKDLQALGRNGGAQAVTGAFEACPGDKDVALAGLLAVAKLSMSSENRRLLGQAGVCPMISKELLDFSHDEAVAEEGCRAVTRLAALSGFNRTALGHARAAEATATALLKHPSKPKVQRWGLSAAAALVAETDPSGNTDRITSAGILGLAVKALMKFRHNPTVQAEGLKTFAKVATSGKDGNEAVWAAGVVLTVVRALGLYLNDANIQHWGVATMRALTGSDDRCDVWRGAGAPEAVVRTLAAFGRDGTGRHATHDEEGLSRASETRPCTAEESLCVQFQACATAFNLAMSSPDARRRIVREGAGEALAGMMKSNSSNQAALRGALATLAALSASGADNRKPSALESFPEDRRVRCEGALTVQNLSLTPGGARAMTKAGVAPVIIRLLRTTLEESSSPTTSEREGEGEEGPTLNGAIANGHSGGKPADRDVIVYLLNGLANMAAADKNLSDFIGRHGACKAVVFALEHHPRDLQMQASGVKAVRALALGGCRNVQDLARLRGPSAIARAQGLFLRDREIQLAVGAAMEALCRGGNRANQEALVGAGTIVLLESALTQFASDAEVVSQSFRALVEIVLGGVGPKTVMGAEGEDSQRCSRSVAGVEEEPSVKRSFSLPQLTLTDGEAAINGPLQPGGDAGGTVGGVAVGEVSCAVGMVLAVLERNPCRDVCLEAFSALGRLLVNLGATDSESVSVGSNDVRGQTYQNRAATADDTTACHKVSHSGMKGGVSPAGGLLQLAKVRQAVKRALKIYGCDDVDLASRGGQILTLIAVARGRALAQ